MNFEVVVEWNSGYGIRNSQDSVGQLPTSATWNGEYWFPHGCCTAWQRRMNVFQLEIEDPLFQNRHHRAVIQNWLLGIQMVNRDRDRLCFPFRLPWRWCQETRLRWQPHHPMAIRRLNMNWNVVIKCVKTRLFTSQNKTNSDPFNPRGEGNE